MGTIEKRGPNSWRVGQLTTTNEGRKWVRQTLSFPPDMPEAQQRHAAEIALARLLIAIEDGQAKPVERLSVRQFAELWMQNHIEPNCEPPTVKTYRNFLNKRILPLIGDAFLDKLTPLMMSSFMAELRNAPKETHAKPDNELKRKRTPSDGAKLSKDKNKTLSQKTIRHYYDTLNTMFKQAVLWEMIPRNPMDGVARPKVRKKAVKYLDDERAVELLRCLKNEENMSFRSAILLALTCGLRLGEAGALNLSDVDWEQGTIDIQRARKYTPEAGSYDGDTKSEAGERLITLPPAMLALLDETRKYQADLADRIGDRWRGDGRIVCSWDGTALHHDTPSKQWRTFADKNGFKGVRFHDLRHSHATLLFASNIDAVAIASRLGHSDASTTLRTYAHALRRRDVDSANAMQALMERADT